MAPLFDGSTRRRTVQGTYDINRGEQQVGGESFEPTDLYAPIGKAYEARLLLAIAAAEGCPVWKIDHDTNQALHVAL